MKKVLRVIHSLHCEWWRLICEHLCLSHEGNMKSTYGDSSDFDHCHLHTISWMERNVWRHIALQKRVFAKRFDDSTVTKSYLSCKKWRTEGSYAFVSKIKMWCVSDEELGCVKSTRIIFALNLKKYFNLARNKTRTYFSQKHIIIISILFRAFC